jgi:putative redox protein
MVSRLRFEGSTGAELAAVFHPAEPVGPGGAARGSLLVVHCFTCSKDLHTMSRLARGLAANGFAVLRFDFTGLGESGGDFADTTLSTDMRDLGRALACLREHGPAPYGLVGHSMGGAAGLLAAAGLPALRSLAVLGAPCTAEHVKRLLPELDPGDGPVQVRIGERSFPISPGFMDDLDRHEVERQVAELGRPLLVLHGLEDQVVPVEHGERLFAAASQPKAFVPLLGADHLLSSKRASAEAVAVLTDWFARTL